MSVCPRCPYSKTSTNAMKINRTNEGMLTSITKSNFTFFIFFQWSFTQLTHVTYFQIIWPSAICFLLNVFLYCDIKRFEKYMRTTLYEWFSRTRCTGSVDFISLHFTQLTCRVCGETVLPFLHINMHTACYFAFCLHCCV